MARKGKVTVVGAGFYGSTTAMRLAEYDIFDTVVLTDIVEGKPEGLALDMNQSRPIEGFETKVVGQTTGPNGEGYEAIAGSDVVVITAGLPRVEELFEARKPKGKAEISRIDGVVEVVRTDAGTTVEVTHREIYEVELDLPIDAQLTVREGDALEAGQLIGSSASQGDLVAPVKGLLVKAGNGWTIRAEDVVPASKYPIPHNAKLLVKNGDRVRAGDPLTEIGRAHV